MGYKRFRKKWENYVGNHSTVPLQTFKPTCLKDVVKIVNEAEANKLRVRAVGSGHSFSDVALTDGFLILPDKLNKVFIPLDTSLFKDGVNSTYLVHLESGTTIRKLNKVLERNGMALPNMGGFDAQTFVGAMSTSTHGSGIEFPPFPDLCKTIETVGEGGKLYRVEPKDGITDPEKFKQKYSESDRVLIQDDQTFRALKVSMGCMGIIYSVIIQVREKFWLTEVRTRSTWEEVKDKLMNTDLLTANEHVDLILNPYIVKGSRLCILGTRNDTHGEPHGGSYRKTHRNWIVEFLMSIPMVRNLTVFFLKWQYRKSGELLNKSLLSQVGEFTSISYKVFNIGKANYVPVYSMEVNFPMRKDGEDHYYLKGIQKFLDLVEQDEKLGKLFINGPVGIRFVKASDAYLSAQYGRDTVTVEIPSVKGTKGAFQMFARFEDSFYEFSGRPHWGQVNTITGSHDFVKAMYPEYDKWVEVFDKYFNDKGTFNNAFSKRVGFNKEEFRN